jgi:hypothetical protein
MMMMMMILKGEADGANIIETLIEEKENVYH